jgi:enoyl-CoA hydratase
MRNYLYKTIEVKVDKREHLAWIALNRPEKLNAFDVAMRKEFQDALKALEFEDEVYIIIIEGKGNFFSAGADINELYEEGYKFLFFSNEVFNYAERCCKLVIAAIDGYAVGGGFELALACDFRIATTRAVFGLPEIKLGVMPGAGGTQRLPRLIGISKAKEMVMTGRLISSKKAQELGLLDRVVKPENLKKEVIEFSKQFTDKPPLALKVIKNVMNKGLETHLETAMDLEIQGFAVLWSTEDRKEGIRAFLEKRKPKFQGK